MSKGASKGASGGKLDMFTAQSVAFLLQTGLLVVGLLLFCQWLPQTELYNTVTDATKRSALSAALLLVVLFALVVLALGVRRGLSFLFSRTWTYLDLKAEAAMKAEKKEH